MLVWYLPLLGDPVGPSVVAAWPGVVVLWQLVLAVVIVHERVSKGPISYQHCKFWLHSQDCAASTYTLSIQHTTAAVVAATSMKYDVRGTW